MEFKAEKESCHLCELTLIQGKTDLEDVYVCDVWMEKYTKICIKKHSFSVFVINCTGDKFVQKKYDRLNA